MNCDTNCPGTPECMCLCHSEPNLSEESFFVSEEEREGTCGGDLNCEVNVLVLFADVVALVTPKMVTITALIQLSCQVMILNLISVQKLFKR